MERALRITDSGDRCTAAGRSESRRNFDRMPVRRFVLNVPEAFRNDAAGYVARFGLVEAERDALIALDRDALRDRFAINPMLLYQLESRMQ